MPWSRRASAMRLPMTLAAAVEAPGRHDGVEHRLEHPRQREARPVAGAALRAQVADRVALEGAATVGAAVVERGHTFPFRRATYAA